MLNINVASAEEIDAVEGLTGHGHEIVRYRGERGGFTSLRQLDEVPGMSSVMNETLSSKLTVGSSENRS